VISLDEPRHIHFVGIGGVGMGGIAEVLLTLGHHVTGSDIGDNPMTARLRSLGAKIAVAHNENNINGAEFVVISSAIAPDNEELIAAQHAGLPILPRANMLSILMQSYYGIAVAGTHGKTTTTSLLASVLSQGQLDPTFVIGGRLQSAGTNAQLGKGEYFVAEADESDASFLCLHPKIALVTNIDADHMATYGGDFNRLEAAFVSFLSLIPDDGLSVLCYDCDVVRKLLPQVNSPKVTYGFSEGADLQAINYKQNQLVAEFTLVDTLRDKKIDMVLNLPGKHNVCNALAAYATGAHLGVNEKDAYIAFKQFQGVGRRFQILGDFAISKGVATVIDDYGHHPSELSATITAARAVWPDRRLVVAFQPHRFTRTRDLYDDFVSVLSTVDHLFLCDIYPASEPPIPGVSGQKMLKSIKTKITSSPVFVEEISQLPSIIYEQTEDNDVVLMMGAGSIGGIARTVAEHGLRRKK